MINIYENIPQELKEIDNWVCYNNKKQPINPNTGFFAKPNDSSTWADYTTAVYVADNKGLGIGFMIGDTDYIGIDIDNLSENKEVAREFINSLASYTEYSPSRNGIHIWVKGQININRYRKGDIEVYDKSSPRYLTFTGNVIGDYKEINTTTDELMRLHKKYIGNDEKSNVIQMPSKPLDLSEQEILSLIQTSNQGSKFEELYRGNWQNYYNSQSEADLALANILAFWTQRDYQKMDSIFRSSGLYREKWDEKRADGTYGQIILSKAISDTTEVYTPRDSYSISIQNQEHIPQTGSNLVQAIGKQYFKVNGDFPIPISTFVIELKEIIHNDLDSELYYKCNFISQEYSQEITFKAKEMNNKTNFMDLLQHPSFSFSGSLNDLQEIKKILSRQPYKTLRGVSYIGFHDVEKKRVFITQDKAIDSNFKEITDLTINEEHQVVTTDILKQNEITKDELVELSKHLFKFNDLKITSSIISMLPVFMMKPLLFKENIKTQHLIIYGEAGSGKSQTVENIVLPFFSLDKQDVLSCSNVTQFSLLRALSNTNSLPVILEEYKPSFLSESQVRMISDNLRNTYDCHNATRGTRSQQLIHYPMLAPIVLIGEEGQEETAIKERSIILNFNKQSRENREKHFFYLKHNPGLLQRFGRSILNKIMVSDSRELTGKRQELMGKFIADEITEDRVRDSIGNLLLGFSLILGVYKDLGVHFEKTTNVKVTDVIKALNENLFREVLDESRTTKSVIDNTIELFSVMVETRNADFNHDYTVVNGNELALNVSSLYPKLTKFVREYNINTEIITNQRQFTRQLRNTKYFMDYKPVKFDSKLRRAYVLNIDLLEEKNIDIESMINNVVERKY